MTPEWTLQQVESISHLRVVGSLGQGGMGNVFKAIDQNGYHLAVKIFHPDVVAAIADNEDIFADFQTAAQVQHPRLCQLKDFYRDDPITFVTMEYVHGKSLRAILKQKRQTPVKGGLQIALDTIRGIAALHNVGLTHGDIRPVNILVLAKRSIKLIDYGIRYPAALCTSKAPKTK
ncbi:MAG: protein kinase, partial [Cyanobacteria bacterium J06659_2]